MADDKPKNDKPILTQVKIYSPYRVYFDDKAYSISAINGTGPFDVLPGHKNFLTLLKPCDIEVEGLLEPKKLKIDRGVMHVRKDKVTVFLDV